MTQRRWQLRRVVRRSVQGDVWLVQTPAGQRGYFKCTRGYRHYWTGPMVVNEIVAAALARRLGLPIAGLELATIVGPQGRVQRGLVSMRAATGTVVPWRYAPGHVKADPARYINRLDVLAGVAVYDAWISNYDRYLGDNLILWRKPGEIKYDWYLIDNALGLYGAPQKWHRRGRPGSRQWRMIWRFYYVRRNLLSIHSRATVEPMISRIERLSQRDIDEAINAAPSQLLTPRLRRFIRNLLLTRQRSLRSMVAAWLAHEGLAEGFRSTDIDSSGGWSEPGGDRP